MFEDANVSKGPFTSDELNAYNSLIYLRYKAGKIERFQYCARVYNIFSYTQAPMDISELVKQFCKYFINCELIKLPISAF